MKRVFLIGFLFVVFNISLFPQIPPVTIFNECVPTFSTLPTDWTSNNGGGAAIVQTATNGYLLVDHVDDWVITKAYDLSGYIYCQLTLDIASYGSAPFNPLTIEVSNDNGATWTHQSFVTETPTTSSPYISQGPYNITASGTQVKFRFRRNASSGAGVRFRNIKLIGIPTAGFLSFGSGGYSQNFSGFVSLATFPSGWFIKDASYTYQGDFGSGTAGGLRGNGVLGMQLTGTAPNNNLKTYVGFINNTGSTITELVVQYRGRVARTVEGSPKWTVLVDNTVIPQLEYSTADGIDKDVSYTVTGLNIPNGKAFTVEWQTTQSGISGDIKQIGITNVNISVPSCSAPTTNASAMNYSSLTNTSVNLAWTSGNGSKRIVVAKANSSITGTPTNNTTYNANATFGSGDQIATGEYVVYNGTGNSVTVTGLTGGTTYYFKVFEYNCLAGFEKYLVSGTQANISVTTLPTGLSAITVKCIGNDHVTLEWSLPSGNYDGIVIGARAGTTAVHSLSADPSTLTANSTFGLGTQFGTGPNFSYVVYKGTGTSVTITGLSNQAYQFKGFVYHGTNWATSTPTTSVSSVALHNVTSLQKSENNNSITLGWVNPNSACFDEVIVVAHTSSITGTPSGTYVASSSSFTDANNPNFPGGGKVVYNGTGQNVTVTSLTGGTQYYFKIFVRKGTQWSTGVEITGSPTSFTVLDYGDLAIVGVNTNIRLYEESGSGTSVDEFRFVMFKDFLTNSTLDFTDNGYERLYSGYWGTTEGVIRLTRTGPTIPAGTIITVRGADGGANPILGTHFNIYVNGNLDNSNWSIQSLNGSYNFNLNDADQIWVMQNGVWSVSGTHYGTYTGKVLYGWTAIGWMNAPGYNSTSGSTLYPFAECSNTNVNALSDRGKVKYNGPTTAATARVWISRFNTYSNWQGYPDNASYLAGGTLGNTITINPSGYSDNYWVGETSNNWFDCTNWGTYRVPDENTDVAIPSGKNLVIEHNSSQIPKCKDLFIENGASLTIDVGKKLTVYGNIQNNGTLTVKSSSTGDGSLIVKGSVNNANNYKIERYLSHGKWHLVSSPITSSYSGLFITHWMRFYDESKNNWGEYIVPTNIPTPPGVGFSIWVKNQDYTPVFNGVINTGNVSVNLTRTNSSNPNSGFNLIGNPFTSAIDWEASSGWTRNNVGTTIYIWNPQVRQYATYNRATGTATNGGSRYIAMGQGFFVHASSNTSITMNSDIQVHNSVAYKSDKIAPDNIYIKVEGNNLSDECYLFISNDASEDFDYNYDAIKLFGNKEAPQLYTTKNQIMLTQNSVNKIDDVFDKYVYLQVGKDTTYKIVFNLNSENSYNVELIDLFTNKSIMPGEEYIFFAKADDSPQRFAFKRSITGTNRKNVEPISIWAYNNILYVYNNKENELPQIEIYDLQGKLVLTSNQNQTPVNLKGLYVVKVTTTNNIVVKKVFIE